MFRTLENLLRDVVAKLGEIVQLLKDMKGLLEEKRDKKSHDKGHS